MSTKLVLGILGVSLLATACGGGAFSPTSTSGSGGNGSTADQASALDTPNAGLDPTSNEGVAFSDREILALPEMDATLADATDMTADLASKTGATAYRIAMFWGHIPAPQDASSADTEPVREDWTGAVSVDAGAIGMKRTIAFDVNDHLDPRTSPLSVSFTSHTLPYVDGMLLRVIVPSGGSTKLHFTTNALTTDVDLADLPAKVGGVQRLADANEGVAWIGFKETAGCAKGFVHGRWTKTQAAFGRDRGIVSDADGARIGHVRGLWGYAPKRQANIMIGKYIDNDGDGKGLYVGKYGDGAFSGIWGAKDESDTDVGAFEGFYSDGYDKADGRGVWIGRWSEKCN